MPTWERLWDNFVQEELRCSSGSSGQQHMPEGDEDLTLWSKGKKKIGEGARQGPKRGTQPQGSGSGQKKDISKVRCFTCGEMGHYVGHCPKRKKKRQQDGMAATAKEEEFVAQFGRECAFVSYCSVDAPSSVKWGDSVEEDLLTQSSDSEGAQTQFSRTPSSRVTSPPRTTSALELSRQSLVPQYPVRTLILQIHCRLTCLFPKKHRQTLVMNHSLRKTDDESVLLLYNPILLRIV
jgi:hypothetical protein